MDSRPDRLRITWYDITTCTNVRVQRRHENGQALEQVAGTGLAGAHGGRTSAEIHEQRQTVLEVVHLVLVSVAGEFALPYQLIGQPRGQTVIVHSFPLSRSATDAHTFGRSRCRTRTQRPKRSITGSTFSPRSPRSLATLSLKAINKLKSYIVPKRAGISIVYRCPSSEFVYCKTRFIWDDIDKYASEVDWRLFTALSHRYLSIHNA